MTTYNINFTDPQKSPIEVEEKGINTDLSVNFPGRIKLEWGEDVNENLLHLLENFAVQAEASDIDTPDSAESGGKLDSPIEGQLWFNKTNNKLYSYDGTRWVPHAEAGQHYGANWGQINHGEQLPLPVSPEGYAFSYDECIWSVSPFTYFNGFEYVQCFADSIDSTVTMIYGNSSGTVIEGVANYLIIGIQGNTNLGTFVPPLPIPSPSPSSTPSPTPDPSDTPTPTPSNSANAPDPSDTPTPTPSVTPSNSPSDTPTPTPSPSASPLAPLSVSDDSNLTASSCDVGTDSNTESISVSATISITGGSGNYSISVSSACSGSTDLCNISSTDTSNGTLSASGTMPCQAGTFTSSVTFDVTDTQTNETASGTATISVDISDLSLE